MVYRMSNRRAPCSPKRGAGRKSHKEGISLSWMARVKVTAAKSSSVISTDRTKIRKDLFSAFVFVRASCRIPQIPQRRPSIMTDAQRMVKKRGILCGGDTEANRMTQRKRWDKISTGERIRSRAERSVFIN